MDERNNYETLAEVHQETKAYQLLKKIEMPFSEYVQISKKRRAIPYIKGKSRIPKKFEKDIYGWDGKDRLVNKLTGELVVRNSRLVGTPRDKKVNGQAIYNGNISRQSRATLVRALHERLAKYLKDIEPITDVRHFPLGIYLIFKVHDNANLNVDNDNKWIWEKAIQDTLVQEKVIPEDNPYVVWENLKRTILIPDDLEESLTLEIYGYA